MSSLRQSIATFRRLDADALGLFLRAWIRVLFWRVRLLFGGPPPTAFQSDVPATNADKADFIDAVARATSRAVRYHFLSGSCLLKSLTIWQFLRDANLPARVVLGVRRDANNQLYAHAWVVSGDRIVGDRESTVAAYQIMEQPTDRGHAVNWIQQS